MLSYIGDVTVTSVIFLLLFRMYEMSNDIKKLKKRIEKDERK